MSFGSAVNLTSLRLFESYMVGFSTNENFFIKFYRLHSTVVLVTHITANWSVDGRYGRVTRLLHPILNYLNCYTPIIVRGRWFTEYVRVSMYCNHKKFTGANTYFFESVFFSGQFNSSRAYIFIWTSTIDAFLFFVPKLFCSPDD